MFIDTTELVLGALGVASSIYDPCIGDPFAPVFVTLARTASVMSLFLCAGRGLLSLAARGELDIDPANIAVIFFAAGAAAPIITRGAWSLVDMGTMFKDLMYESYMPVNCGSLPGAVVNHQNNMQTCNVGSIGVRMFFLCAITAFMNLMSHNLSFHKLAPYARDRFWAIGNNIEKLVYGKAVIDTTAPEDRWDWSKQSWSARLNALLNLVILDALGVAFFMLQDFATLGEVLILAVGFLWISVAVASHVDTLMDDRGNRGNKRFKIVRPEDLLRHVVEDLICCSTCNHRIDERNHITARSSSQNKKAYLDVMQKTRKTSLGGRGTGNRHY